MEKMNQKLPHRLTKIYQQQNNKIIRVLTMGDLIRIILSILIPPLGVFLQVGLGKDFWINILLTLLGYIPGLVHAIWIIAKK